MSLLQAFWFLLPSAIANMAPVFAKLWIPNFSTPIDFGIRWSGRELFGRHKTYRGLTAGILVAVIVFWIQRWLGIKIPQLKVFEIFDYEKTNVFFGAVLGAGALIGDLVKSFFKRRLRIPSGAPWFPYDQLDWIAGTFVFAVLWYPVPQRVIIAAFVVGFFLHIGIKALGFKIKINSAPI